MLTMGSLFDGIAGFPLAASRHGITPVWASEIEPFPIEVSKRHFPTMKHLGSVTDIGLCIDVRGPEVDWYFSDSQGEPVENTDVDIVTFGSPCQDLSVAGKRAGLGGQRSNLFFQAVRVIRDIQDATAGKSPRYAVWENVPGAFSSNKGRDFAAVLKSLVGGEVHVPERGWTDAGVAFGPEGQAAWRLLDAQFWGVPQRRRRIFLVADFGGERAGEILFESTGLPGHLAESRKAREEVAAGVGDGVEAAGRTYAVRTAQTSSNGWGVTEELSYTLDLASGQAVVHPQVTGTLCASGAGMSRPAGQGNETDLVVAIQHSIIGRKDEAGAQGPGFRDDDKMFTLDSRGSGHAVAYADAVQVGYAVRRLTVVECLRLMGFPDWWFDGIPGNSDTACYKACGNSVAIPCVEFIMQRIAAIAEIERSI